jgi:hypothetical protein
MPALRLSLELPEGGLIDPAPVSGAPNDDLCAMD